MDIEAIALAVEADAGMPLPGIRQALAEARDGIGRVTTGEQILTRSARLKTGLTLEAFADVIATPAATLSDWEQGRSVPPGGMLCLLRLIHKHPELLSELAA